MVSFGEKAKIKKAGNLNQGHSYVITTVPIKKIGFTTLIMSKFQTRSFICLICIPIRVAKVVADHDDLLTR